MSWTDERVETLKKLWLDGLSASQIAKVLGGASRNAVIGKVHRLGLCGDTVHRTFRHQPPSTPPTPVRQRRNPPTSGPRLPQAAPPPVESAPVVLAMPAEREPAPEGGMPLMDRAFGQCAWALGESEAGDLMCCGQDTGSRRVSFCAAHSVGLYVPAKPFRDGAFANVAGGAKRRRRRDEDLDELVIGLDGRAA